MPPQSDHVISPSFLDGFPPFRVGFERVFGLLHAYPIRFPLFLQVRHRHQSSSSYPITMNMQYLCQFPMDSLHPGLVSNAFYNVLNALPSVSTFAFALVAVFVVTARIAPSLFQVISQPSPHRSPSLWDRLERVFRCLSICGIHFRLHFHFRHCHHSTPVHCRFFHCHHLTGFSDHHHLTTTPLLISFTHWEIRRMVRSH